LPAIFRMQINLHIVWHRLEKRPRTLSDAEPSSAQTAKTVKDGQRQYSTLGLCCRLWTTLGESATTQTQPRTKARTSASGRLRTQLKNAGVRIQGDIAGYAELSQQTMQLTSIIVDGVRKLPPGAPR
jgi:hypothetical protein